MISYTASNYILDYNFGKTTYTVPSTLYMGLSTTTINNDGTGATEPTGNAYARVAVVNDKSHFAVAALGSLTNNATITFPESTPGAWGTITYIAFWDAATVGNVWFFEALSTPKTVQANTTVVFSVGALTISMTNV